MKPETVKAAWELVRKRDYLHEMMKSVEDAKMAYVGHYDFEMTDAMRLLLKETLRKEISAVDANLRAIGVDPEDQALEEVA